MEELSNVGTPLTDDHMGIGRSGDSQVSRHQTSSRPPIRGTSGTSGTGRVAERAVEEICKYIESKGLVTGDKLPPERVFIDMLGVSRSSLREALRVLSTVGVIDVRHGDGMYVAAAEPVVNRNKALFDATEQNALRNLVETRLGIEFAAVTAATRRATEEDLARLRAMLDEQERRIAADPDFVWDPLGFELAVVEISGNSWLWDVELMLRDSWTALSSGLRASVGRHQEWHSEHRAILASMCSRNVAQAQRLVMAHLSVDRFEEDLSSRAAQGKRRPGKNDRRPRSRRRERDVTYASET